MSRRIGDRYEVLYLSAILRESGRKEKMKIVVSGGTGFIGKKLVQEFLKAGHAVVLLSRKAPAPGSNQGPLKTEIWDAKTLGAWARQIDGADAVVNLTGESIAAKKWTPEQKKKIIESRVDSTRALAEAIQKAGRRPKVWVNASAVGYYGNVESGDVTESSPRGPGFLADVCERWEKETTLVQPLVRVVLLRLGVVLERGGGALAKMEFPFKIFAGGPLGSGRQWFPWIHRDDITGLILFALQNEKLSGPVNATAPEPVTMSDFCKELGRAMHRPSWAPVPAFALKLMLGEMSGMLLGGQKALPVKALQAGYKFRYPRLADALDAVSNKK